MKQDKNLKIQILRAIAIIAVVLIHTSPNGIMQVIVRPFINFAVATFIFLSGYLTDVSKINIKEFYKKRISRVIIPYTIWSVLYTTAGFVANGIDLKKYFINYFTAGGAATMYYIFVYIQFVILTPLLGRLLKKKYWYLGFAVAPISLLFKYYFVITGTQPNIYISTISDVCCLGWFTFYYLGLYLKNTSKHKNYNMRIIIPLYLITIIIQMIEGYYWYKLGTINCGTQLKMSSLLTSSMFILITYTYINSNAFNGKCKTLLLIGDHSFGIYISHCMILELFNHYIYFWKFIPFGINSLILLIITLLCVIIGKRILGEKISKYLGLY